LLITDYLRGNAAAAYGVRMGGRKEELLGSKK